MEREIFLVFLTKKLTGNLLSTEKVELQSAIENNKEYREIHDQLLLHPSSDNLTINSNEALANVWKGIESDNTQKPKAPIRRIRHFSLAAACIFLVIAFYWFLSKEVSTSPKEKLVTLRAQNRKLDTVLTDGSRIILSEKSELSIEENFGIQTRTLVLKGNAFFDVAKNDSVPMIVQAGLVDIIVKGTAFSVANSYSGKLDIQLLRGLIEVRSHGDSVKKTSLYPGQMLSVTQKGDRDLQIALSSLPAASPLKTVFGNDTLRFYNQPLDSLVLLLQKKYETKIEIRNEGLKSKRFSGVFVTETLQEALIALKFTYPFSFKILDQKTVIE